MLIDYSFLLNGAEQVQKSVYCQIEMYQWLNTRILFTPSES